MKSAEQELLAAERLLKESLQTTDPAKIDFSEDYLSHLHDKIMAQVEETEIVQTAPRRGLLPKKWRSLWQPGSIKSISAFLGFTFFLFVTSSLIQSQRRTPLQQNQFLKSIDESSLET